MNKTLKTTDHSRESAGMTYVYPVVSRRAKGVSVGINLNPNNACNWRCIYCQVPDLKKGAAPKIDLGLLEKELDSFLEEICHGDFMQKRVPEQFRQIRDMAISGNGEPTSSKDFPQIVEIAGKALKKFSVPKLVLITNGSLMGKSHVKEGIKKMAQFGGEVWFKLDSATKEGRLWINGCKDAGFEKNLKACAALCPTYIQSCFFATDGRDPPEAESEAYLKFVSRLLEQKVPVRGILLYGISRPSLQPEGKNLSPVSQKWIESFSSRIRALGIPVDLSF